MINFQRQRGAALFIGIFLITVIVVVAAAVALTSATQHTGQARAAAAEQAWYAALARLESEIPNLLAASACPTGGNETLFGYATSFSCEREEVAEGGATYAVYSLEATARRGNLGDAIFVRRTLRSQVSDGEI
jgi:type II secretory pathway pseudopilin PulG